MAGSAELGPDQYSLSMKRTDPGVFIAFEGIDGAGKTTQVGLLADFLTSIGETPVRSKEPTEGHWGRLVRASAASGRMSLADELNALTEDRKEHVRKLVQPALERGGMVILDRYFYSTIAYQGSRGGDDTAIAEQMFRVFPTPDVVFLIDVPPVVGLSRIEEGRGDTPNEFEEHGNLQLAREVFLKLAATHPEVIKVDGTQAIDAVHRVVLRTLLDGVLKSKPWAKG